MVNQNNSMMMKIADIPLLLSSNNDEFISKISAEYQDYIIFDSKPEIKIEVEILPEEFFQDKSIPFENSPMIEYDKENEIYSVYWNKFHGELNLRNRNGKIRFYSNYNGLNLYLRFIYSLLLLEYDGFLVHASSLMKNGKGYIFPGKSGAGKSTIAKLSKDSTLFADEFSMIRKIDEKYYIFGTPFSVEKEMHGKNVCVQLYGIYFPQKDNQNFLREINYSLAIKQLLPNIFFFVHDKNLTATVLKKLEELVQTVPTYQLHFLPEPSFWSCINVE